MSSTRSPFKDFSFADLLTPAGLARLDQAFQSHLSQDPLVLSVLKKMRAGESIEAVAYSEWLIRTAPYLEGFLAELFHIHAELNAQREEVESNYPIFWFKKQWVLRAARRRLNELDQMPSFNELHAWLMARLETDIDLESAVARYAKVIEAHDDREAIDRLEQWCARAMTDPDAQALVREWVSFRFPKKLDYAELVEREPDYFRQREGFGLTDERMSLRQVLDEVHYCVYCHEQSGDFCSKGFPVKKTEPQLGLKKNPLDDWLTGCPLEEKISEMHVLKKLGHSIGALAVIMVDNPMCPATGHRICNDCMKACIYQKQEPVNIPQIETRCLTDVLALPYGLEIYDLLTRWNPLRRTQWVAKPYNGRKVLVMGMGPAGFSLAHHLLMEGCAVVGMDGLKIEPLPATYLTAPIRDFTSVCERLDDRIMAGFGGVAEYGITVRWDKNFLKLIYISLMRRPYFQVYGCVRFGGTLTVEDAWTLGFDHLALAVGAGLPRELRIENSLAPGMRQANDFLMALQLTGAAKSSSLANLELRLPAVIIGGGLTGIDTATEVQAYYLKQIEKIAHRYHNLVKTQGELNLREKFTAEQLVILDEFLAHADLWQQERLLAQREERSPNVVKLIRDFGGVTVAYRRSMQDSPAYRRNHEELTKAFEEGIYYAENLDPVAVVLDSAGYCQALRCLETDLATGKQSETVLPARSIFVATGAKPNIAYEFEHRGSFQKVEQNYERFNLHDGAMQPAPELAHCKEPDFGAFTSYAEGSYRVSFLGDTHPVFHGSVVKAIASAKRVYPAIMKAIELRDDVANTDPNQYALFKQEIQGLFSSSVVSVTRLSEDLIELVVHAPMSVHNYHPGQFYRIQNYETDSPIVEGTRLQTEAIALLASKSSDNPGQLAFLIIERGASTRLVSTFKTGQAIAVMGPSGNKTKLPTDAENWLVMGGTMAVVSLRAVAPIVRERGGHVIALLTMDQIKSVELVHEIQRLCDAVIYLGHEPETPAHLNLRQQDRYLYGSLEEALLSYQAQSPLLNLQAIHRVVFIGSGSLLARVQAARRGPWRELFSAEARFFASVYGAMQCMLKGVCAQCLQWQIDPSTGQRTKAVYACSWHEQPLEGVDAHNLEERLQQNRVAEILTNEWLSYLLTKYDIVRI